MLLPAFLLTVLEENIFYLLLPVLGLRELYVYSLKMELISEHKPPSIELFTSLFSFA